MFNVKMEELYFTFSIDITPRSDLERRLGGDWDWAVLRQIECVCRGEMSNVCVNIVCNTFLNFQLLFPPSQLFPVCFSLISPSFSGCWLPPCPGTASCGFPARVARNF